MAKWHLSSPLGSEESHHTQGAAACFLWLGWSPDAGPLYWGGEGLLGWLVYNVRKLWGRCLLRSPAPSWVSASGTHQTQPAGNPSRSDAPLPSLPSWLFNDLFTSNKACNDLFIPICLPPQSFPIWETSRNAVVLNPGITFNHLGSF